MCAPICGVYCVLLHVQQCHYCNRNICLFFLSAYVCAVKSVHICVIEVCSCFMSVFIMLHSDIAFKLVIIFVVLHDTS